MVYVILEAVPTKRARNIYEEDSPQSPPMSPSLLAGEISLPISRSCTASTSSTTITPDQVIPNSSRSEGAQCRGKSLRRLTLESILAEDEDEEKKERERRVKQMAIQKKAQGFEAAKSKLDSFECPVCLSEPRPYSVNYCVNGHFICKSCARQMSNCPLCRSSLISCRNLMAEELIKTILGDSSVKCKYFNCEVYSPVPLMESHEIVCLYRSISCPAVYKCEFKGDYFKVVSHIKKCPYARYVTGVTSDEKTNFEIGSLGDLFKEAEKFPTLSEFPTLCLIGVDVYGILPCIRIVRHPQQGLDSSHSRWHFYPSCSARPSEAKNYVIEINIESTSGHVTRTYVGFLPPAKINLTDRFHEGFFLELTQLELARSVRENNSLLMSAFVIDLRKKSPPALPKPVPSIKNYFSLT